MRTRLARYARSRVGCALGVAGTALVAISDRLLGIPPDAVAYTRIYPPTSRGTH